MMKVLNVLKIISKIRLLHASIVVYSGLVGRIGVDFVVGDLVSFKHRLVQKS